MKLLIKLVIVALIANAAWRVGTGVRDALQVHRLGAATRRSTAVRADAQLRQRVLELAARVRHAARR